MKSECIIDRCLALWSHCAFDTPLAQLVDDRDLSYVVERAKREGIEFMTVTLPTLGKAIELAMRTGHLDKVPSFATVKDSVLPRFLNRCISQLFSPSGELLWDPAPTYRALHRSERALALTCVRQLTLMFYKLELPYRDEQCAQVSETFLSNERDLLTIALDDNEDSWRRNPIIHRAKFAAGLILGGSPPYDRLKPRHGSGASACGTKPWARYGEPRWSPDLAKVFPYDEWFTPGACSWEDLDWLKEPVDVDPEPLTAEVCFVPKDSRGPRLISKEPREHMYIQQALMDCMYTLFKRLPRVKAALDCTDQTRNRELAVLASEWQTHATLDMKDASDRVSCELVRALVPPEWWRALDACRTKVTVMPDGSRVPLMKFAPMGSACCFPIEALVFYCLAIATVNPTNRLVHEAIRGTGETPFMERVSVFGDDIIVPNRYVESLVKLYTSCGLTVNLNKSYTQGPFRESCGMDCYDGIDCTIVRVRHLPISSGTRGEVNHAMFRTRDFLNQVVVKYGTGGTNRGAEVFADLYQAPLVLADIPSWSDPGGGIDRVGNSLIMLGYQPVTPPTLRTRVRSGVTQVKTLRERSVDIEIDTSDWSHVLRVFLIGSRERDLDGPDHGHAGMVTPARRLRYNKGWVQI